MGLLPVSAGRSPYGCQGVQSVGGDGAGLKRALRGATPGRLSRTLELSHVQRLALVTLYSAALGLDALATLWNSGWVFLTGRWFESKPIRFVGTFASLGLFVALWKPGVLAAVAVLVPGVAVMDGAVLLAEARQRKLRA
jgi:hypothetical protein